VSDELNLSCEKYADKNTTTCSPRYNITTDVLDLQSINEIHETKSVAVQQ